QKAVRVRREAAPEVVAKVQSGKLSLNAAEKTIQPKGRDLKTERVRVFNELANEYVPCDWLDMRDAALQRFNADRLVPKSNPNPANYVSNLMRIWLHKHRSYQTDYNRIERRKGKAAPEVPAAAAAADDEQSLFDALTDKVQTYLDDAVKQVPESFRGHWREFLQRVVEGLQS
ncbi:MAG: hypothetical protein ACK5YO_19845, partial [Planctomyces sp.]